MIICSALLLLTMSDELPAWVPSELRNSEAFEVTFPTNRSVASQLRLSFRRLETGSGVLAAGSSVLIDVGKSTPSYADQRILMSVDPPGMREHAPSGIPIGHQVRLTSKPGLLHFRAVNEWETVHVGLVGPLVREGKNRRNRPDDYSSAESWVEALAREAMGKFASRRAGPVTDRQIAGAAVQSFVAADTSAVMVDLAGWAQANNVGLNVNSEAHRASFSWRGKTHIVALATDQIKVGGEWGPMTDIVIMHQDKMWVPLSALD